MTAWPLLVLQVFDIWDRYPVFNIGRNGGWYQFGFLLGAGSPVWGIINGGPFTRRSKRR